MKKNTHPPGGPPRDGSPRDGHSQDPILQEGLDLWRDDAARSAQTVELTGLADRVVAAARAGEPPRLSVLRAAPRYAAAAVLLMAVGVAGTLITRHARSAESRERARPDWVVYEKALFDAMVVGSHVSLHPDTEKEGR